MNTTAGDPLPRIRDALAARGLDLPPKHGPPDPPEDVTLLDPDALGRLMSDYANLIAYVATEEATAAARAKSLSARYKHERAVRYLELKATDARRSDKHIDARLDADAELHALREHELGADAYARLLRALQNGYEHTAALLSREITRRSLGSERALD